MRATQREDRERESESGERQRVTDWYLERGRERDRQGEEQR